MAQREHTLTDLLRNPRTVIAGLDGGDVVVRRRDGDDFVIQSLSRHRYEATAVGLLAALLRGSQQAIPGASASMQEQLPWIRFLPTADREAFVVELLDTITASASLGAFAPVSVLIDQWRHTAEIWADPELHRTLSTPLDDLDGRRVPEPPAR